MKNITKTPDILLVGMSHKTAPVDLRECFSLEGDRAAEFIDRACGAGIGEVVFISTCNRVEVYAASEDVNASAAKIIELLEHFSGLKKESFEGVIYKKYSRDAVIHLLTVTSSLDSMVVGENEILGQMKKAYSSSVQQKASGMVLNRLFHQAFKTAKRVRTETEIARNPLSIAYISVELAGKIFENLSEKKAMLIGAGEMGELILKYFTKYRINEITIANRSLHNAQRIAADINREAHIIPLDDIASGSAGSDIIISSAASKEFIIGVDSAKAIVRKRGREPLFIIDISVPRNIDPEVGKLNNVYLYNIDDLKTIADENLRGRLNEVDIAKSMIESDAGEFYEWYEGLIIVPAIVRMQDRLDVIRKNELEKYRKRKLKHLKEEDFKIVEDLTKQIMTKTLHNPIMHLKKYRAGNRQNDRESMDETARLIEELFKE
jgi:glutamyl-tRNA reductase